MTRTLAILALAALPLAGCDEAAMGALGGTPALGGGGGSAAIGDSAFVRDERGCLYEMIGGARVPIVGPDGRHDCARAG